MEIMLQKVTFSNHPENKSYVYQELYYMQD